MAWYRCGVEPKPESYIYNIGNCAFNTGYVPKANTKIVMKAVPNIVNICSSWNYLFCANPNGNQTRWFSFATPSGRPTFMRCTNSAVTGSYYYDQSGTNFIWFNVPQIFEFEGRTARWYREEVPNEVNSLSMPDTVEIIDGLNTIALFAKNFESNSGGYGITDLGSMLLYYFDIYENDVLLHHFIPAYNNSQYCLYDKISNTYIYDTVNSGANVRGFVLS